MRFLASRPPNIDLWFCLSQQALRSQPDPFRGFRSDKHAENPFICFKSRSLLVLKRQSLVNFFLPETINLDFSAFKLMVL